MKLIVNADDFGFSENVNLGIIDVFKNGIVTSTTMMMNMPAVEHGFELYKENKGLGLGIHLNLTVGKPILEGVPSLVKENGVFHYVNEIEKHAQIEDVYKEMKAQIERFISFGLFPSHLDGHHHTFLFPKFKEVTFRLAKEYNLPIRIRQENKEEARRLGIKTVDYFVEDFYDKGATMGNLENLLKQYPKECIVEVMTHPGYMDEETAKRTSYTIQREQEIKELVKLKESEVLKRLDVEFVNYSMLK